MTSNNEEVIRSSNTQMTRGVPKSKSTDSVGEGKIKKSGVQLRRCLSLYDRKRNPHFCKDRVLIPKEENKSRRAFGLIADENVLKKERTMPVTDGRVIANKPTRTNLQRRQTMPDKVNNAHEMSVALCTPNCNQKRKIIETWKPPRGVESDVSEEVENLSTITNGTSRSMVSSTVSHESDSSSELDFDALVPIKLSSRNSDSKSTRHSLIPRRVRPRSATLSLSDGIVNDYIGNELKASRQGRNLTRSISWYEKRITSFSNGTEVSIKIRESVSSSESSYSSTDDVFLTMPKATKAKAVSLYLCALLWCW